ncbi:Mbov_0398 family ICE element protein [[Mycoplasma] gypis]|uniref:ICEF Integrative Conjugal Element-II n=1 Tax=[Mycoplasma] gypis TaxID=92404 RepID=A0ABZ2RQR0_9BACT|nr:hypothetical protein [[Mycoplasma] gypis]MBN0919385.1 hypothetical protein [[Mycoplasma] gypis]
MSNSKEERLTIRFYNDDNREYIENIKRSFKRKGQNLNNYLQSVVLSHFEELDKQAVLKDIKNDMFYSFRKAFFSSLAPFQANINAEIFNNRLELLLINKKIDAIINILISQNKNEKINYDDLNLHYANEILQEQSIFELLRENIKVSIDKDINEQNNKVKKAIRRQENFEKYDIKQFWDATQSITEKNIDAKINEENNEENNE